MLSLKPDFFSVIEITNFRAFDIRRSTSKSRGQGIYEEVLLSASPPPPYTQTHTSP